ncbi:DHA1 family inner membrane transport protein [Streptacidiphilus sp. MAP12-16]|uniref:MFS transporter n=1 Tax=Streptacidiphilus sp. MAP12-16 TaxID=3156300 RepID=UPI003516B4B0
MVTRVSWLSFLVMLTIGTDTFLVAPLLPTLTHAYHNAPAWSGWMVSAYAIGYAVLALVAGPISDRLDRKTVLVYGLVAFAVLTGACAFAPNFWSMVGLRFATGVSAAFVTPQIWASIPVLIPPQQILRTMGFATGGLSIAQMIGVPIGSFLAGWTWHAPFLVLAAVALLMAGTVQLCFPHVPGPGQGTPAGPISSYATLLRTPTAPSLFLAYLLFQTGNFTSFSFIGTWLTTGFGLSVTKVGLAIVPLGAANAIGSLFGARLATRLGPAKSRRAAIGGLIVLFAVLPFAPDLWVTLALLCAIFLIGGFVFPVFMATMQGLTTTARGTVSALTNSTMYLGTTVGGMIGGLLITRFSGFHGISVAVIALMALSLACYVHADRKILRPNHTKETTQNAVAEERSPTRLG